MTAPGSPRTPTWLVTGGTGAIGPAVVAAILDTGACVRLLARQRPDPLPAPTEVVIGDIGDRRALVTAMEGVDVVVHAAAHPPVDAPSESVRRHQWSVNVGGAHAVADAAEITGPERVVFLSSVAVYGPSRGEPRDEQTAPRPRSAYGASKLAAEQVLVERLGVRLCVLRPCSVYGSGLTGAYATLVRAVTSRLPIPVLSGHGHCLVTDRDLGRFVLLAARSDAAGGRCFNITDGRLYTTAEIVEAIKGAWDRPTGATPFLSARLASAALVPLERLGGPSTSRRRRLQRRIGALALGPQIDSRAAHEVLGPVDCEDLTVGWTRALAR